MQTVAQYALMLRVPCELDRGRALWRQMAFFVPKLLVCLALRSPFLPLLETNLFLCFPATPLDLAKALATKQPRTLDSVGSRQARTT